MDMQNVSNLEIPEGEVRTIHDKDSVLLWGRVNYDTKYAGDTFQQTYSGKNLFNNYDTNYIATNTNPGTITFTTLLTGLKMDYPYPGNPWALFKVGDMRNYKGKTIRLSMSFTSGATDYRLVQLSEDGTNRNLLATSTTSGETISFTIPANFNDTAMPYFGVRVTATAQSSVEFTNLILTVDNEDMTYEPYTGGQPSPSPDYPQEIQTVTGEQTVRTTGKNICSETKVENATKNLFFRLPKLSSGDIVLSCTPGVTMAGNTYGILIDGVGFTQLGTWSTNASGKLIKAISLTAEQVNEINDGIEAGNAVWIRTYRAAGGFTQPDDAMIEYGTAATTYEAYQSNDFPISLTGKNLFSSPIIIGGWSANGGTISRTTRFKSQNKMSVSSNTIYTISGTPKDSSKTLSITVQTYDSNEVIIRQFPSSNTWGNVPFTFTTPSDCAYITISGRYSDDTAFGTVGDTTDAIQNVMLEQGSTATSYEPYFTPIELAKIGDYQDYIYRDADGDWYVHKATNKEVLDGSSDEQWVRQMSSGNYDTAWFQHPSEYPMVGGAICFSNNFTPISSISYQNTTEGITIRPDSIRIRWQMATIQNLTNWRDWLASHPTTVYYVLQTPTDTQITDQTLISQLEALHEWMVRYGYYGTVSGNLPMIIKRTALS